jgi:hypothetical protein
MYRRYVNASHVYMKEHKYDMNKKYDFQLIYHLMRANSISYIVYECSPVGRGVYVSYILLVIPHPPPPYP